jgi:citrate synthase
MGRVLVLLADHELNASTFAARVAASTLTDLHSAVLAAICTLKGPLHGGAVSNVDRMLREIGSADGARAWIDDAVARKERVAGFGHRVYRAGDPRARVLKELSRELAGATGDRQWYERSVRLEAEVEGALGLLPNVDFYAASVYTYLSIPAGMFTPVFAMSRVSGWIAHIMEQYADNRLIRPRAEYVGSSYRAYSNRENR